VIVVTGATGNVGGELVRALAARGDTAVRAVARRPDPSAFPPAVEVAAGELTDPASLGPALDGARGLFLLGGFATQELLAAARQAGVDRVALLTSRCVVGGRPDNAITRMWLDAEDAVRSSGLGWTILRPSGFHSNALRWLPQLRAGDVVQAPWPEVAIASIDPADIAAVAAVALTEPGHEGTAPALSGPQALTPAEQIAVLADVLGRPLQYEPLADEDARAGMAADGTPAPFVDALFRFFSDGEFDDTPVVDSVRAVTGREPRTFAEWARAHVADLTAVPEG
jgi:uncharacterized protein YbjT (DUF2867 family)